MNQNELIELGMRVEKRKLDTREVLLTIDEMSNLSKKEIYQLAERLPLALGFEIQACYYENRQRTDKQLLEETEEEIRAFEQYYQGDFETIFGGLTEEQMDTQDDVMNYLDWFELVERKKQLVRKIENETT